MAVSITAGTSAAGKARIRVRTPYHPQFSGKAKALGGVWDAASKVWSFDARDEGRVREVCLALFGTDGSAAPTLATARVTLRSGYAAKKIAFGAECWLFGRCLARRANRDWAVRLGEDVMIVYGTFAARGGSRANPDLSLWTDTVVLEVRDIPASLLHEAMEKYPDDIVEVS